MKLYTILRRSLFAGSGLLAMSTLRCRDRLGLYERGTYVPGHLCQHRAHRGA